MGQDRNVTDKERRLFDRILKYTGVFGGVYGFTMLVTILTNKVKSLLLGPMSYGITESLNRSTDLIKNSTNLGIATVSVPEISESARLQDAARLESKVLLTRSWALLTAIAGMAVCFALAPLLNRWAFGSDGRYTLGFMVLSLSVAAAAVMGGETAVLRGAGMLREIAMSQLFTGIISLCISAPLYWYFRMDGIVPALALVAVGSMAVSCCYSFRRFPYRVCPFRWSLLRQGTGMIGMGVYFTVVAFLSAWAWSYIAKFLMDRGGSELTGVYSAGYMLVTYFTKLLLSVMDSEYYPRLSASGNNMKEAGRIMNNQSLAMCMLSAPLVIMFILLAPVAVYITLEYEKFHMSIVLAQLAVVGLFFKCVSQPIAYILLARSDAKMYLVQETLCYILLIVCAVTGFNLGGLTGLGASFAVWELLYLLLSVTVCGLRYGFCMAWELVRNFLIQGLLVAAASVCVVWCGTPGFVAAGVLCLASVVFSLRFFINNTTFLPSLFSKISGKIISR